MFAEQECKRSVFIQASSTAKKHGSDDRCNGENVHQRRMKTTRFNCPFIAGEEDSIAAATTE